ncbi:hypothetical protein [Haliangium sp.]|uniref:hypothetical protein n=1 Tax=Haliangium sp. TaxID=2663208 RepID=UPI003D0DE4BA
MTPPLITMRGRAPATWLRGRAPAVWTYMIALATLTSAALAQPAPRPPESTSPSAPAAEVSSVAPAADDPPEAPTSDDSPGAPSPDAPPRPDNERRALALMAEGQALASEYALTEATKKYREALTHWDHPAIHYNLCLLLAALDRPLEAYRSAQRALAADLPLHRDPDRQRQMRALLEQRRDELRRQLAQVALTSEEPSALVSLDSHDLAPTETQVFAPGRHRVSVQKRGLSPLLRSIELPPGTTAHLHLTASRPYTPWKPWATLGAGSATAVAGAISYLYGRHRYDELAREVAAACLPSCDDSALAAEFDRDWRRARRLQQIGAGALVVGTTAALIGAGLVLQNRRRRFRLQTDVSVDAVSIAPVLSPEMSGVVGTVEF